MAKVFRLFSSMRSPGDHKSSCDCRYDYANEIPEELLICIFQSPSLNTADKNSISLVCRRWYEAERCSRQELYLYANAGLIRFLPSLFSRFHSVKKISLSFGTMDDDALVMISKQCRNLERLKLHGLRKITDAGMADFAKNCQGLKELSVRSCLFGADGFNYVMNECSFLERLSVEFCGSIEESRLIGPGRAAESLKSISIVCVGLTIGLCFAPLIISSKNLEILRLEGLLGNWDTVLMSIGKCHTKLERVALETISVTDAGLAALAGCANLKVVHLGSRTDCSDTGIISLARGCTQLRKLHIDGKCSSLSSDIGDDGLLAVAQHCPNIIELDLVHLNLTPRSLVPIASKCLKLERLSFRECDTITDTELACMGDVCASLRELSIKRCPVSSNGVRALAHGFPNLRKVKVSKCSGVSKNLAMWLQKDGVSFSIQLKPEKSILQKALRYIVNHCLQFCWKILFLILEDQS